MLARFISFDAIYRLRDTGGRRLEEVAEMMLEAEAMPPEGRTKRGWPVLRRPDPFSPECDPRRQRRDQNAAHKPAGEEARLAERPAEDGTGKPAEATEQAHDHEEGDGHSGILRVIAGQRPNLSLGEVAQLA